MEDGHTMTMTDQPSLSFERFLSVNLAHHYPVHKAHGLQKINVWTVGCWGSLDPWLETTWLKASS